MKGYPTMIVLDAAGTELARTSGYQSSKQMLRLIRQWVLMDFLRRHGTRSGA